MQNSPLLFPLITCQLLSFSISQTSKTSLFYISLQSSSGYSDLRICHRSATIKQSMATRGCNMTMFDMFFVSAILTMTICVATWNGYAKCETVYKWMEADFTAAILFRILMTVELHLASGMGLDLFGEHVHYCARAVVLSAIYMIFYPFLWAWNTIGFVWWFTSSEKDWLPGSGLVCCYFIFLLICFYELFRFACSSVEKHIAAQRPLTPILRADKGIPISKNKVHDLLADSEHAYIHHSG